MAEKPNKGCAEKSCISGLLEWLDSIVASVIVVVLLFTFVIKVVGIKGPSMNNTLYEGDRVIIYQLNYTPKVGDIVVISRNITNIKEDENTDDERIIKRVVATEGQVVNIGDSGLVTVDGVELADTYVKDYAKTYAKSNGVEFPHVVADGCVFVLGDNRLDSLDSRSKAIGNNGDVDVRYILGHAVCRIAPISEFKWL